MKVTAYPDVTKHDVTIAWAMCLSHRVFPIVRTNCFNEKPSRIFAIPSTNGMRLLLLSFVQTAPFGSVWKVAWIVKGPSLDETFFEVVTRNSIASFFWSWVMERCTDCPKQKDEEKKPSNRTNHFIPSNQRKIHIKSEWKKDSAKLPNTHPASHFPMIIINLCKQYKF